MFLIKSFVSRLINKFNILHLIQDGFTLQRRSGIKVRDKQDASKKPVGSFLACWFGVALLSISGSALSDTFTPCPEPTAGTQSGVSVVYSSCHQDSGFYSFFYASQDNYITTGSTNVVDPKITLYDVFNIGPTPPPYSPPRSEDMGTAYEGDCSDMGDGDQPKLFDQHFYCVKFIGTNGIFFTGARWNATSKTFSEPVAVTNLPDRLPEPFNFTNATDVSLGSLITSESITISGIDAPSPISVTGGDSKYSIGGDPYTSVDGTIAPGQSVTVRHTSTNPPTITALNIGGIVGTFTSLTRTSDCGIPYAGKASGKPAIYGDCSIYAFYLVPYFYYDAGTGTLKLASGSGGFSPSVYANKYRDIGASAGGNPENVQDMGSTYSGNCTDMSGVPGSYDGKLTVENGHFYCYQEIGSNGALYLGGRWDAGENSFTDPVAITTFNRVPDAFSFIDQILVPLASTMVSNSITVNGIDAGTDISITGGKYAINSGSYTSAPGTVNNGDKVTVSHTSSANQNTATGTALTIGGVSDTFTSITEDTTPDAFSFTAQPVVPVNSTIVSNSITVNGINAPATISVTGGKYAINSGSYTSAPGTVNNGDKVTVSHTSSANQNTATGTALTIGGVSDTFTSTTEDTILVMPVPVPMVGNPGLAILVLLTLLGGFARFRRWT